MTFDELVDEVYTLTNRPDLVAETASAVKAATLKAHQTDFYSRDIYELDMKFDEKKYIHSLDVYGVICNYRALKYVRHYDESGTPETGTFLEVITPDEVLDSYYRNRSNVVYMAGRMLEMRACVDFDRAIMGCYVLPIVTPATSYSSWIAIMHPYAIIKEAARVMFKTIGYDEQSAQYNQLVAEEYALLKITGIADQGY